MVDSSTPRTGAAIRTGPLRAARTVLAEVDAGSVDERERALTRVALGHLMRQDGLRGLSHPTDARLVRPGLLGSVVGVLVACVFTGIALVVLGATGVGPFAGDDPAASGGNAPADPFGGAPTLDGDWSMTWAEEDPGPPDAFAWVAGGFALVGLLLLLATLLTLAVRLRCVARGTRLVKEGRSALAAQPGGGATGDPTEAQVLERVYPRFAGMLSWTLPRRTSYGHGGHHDHHDDPFD